MSNFTHFQIRPLPTEDLMGRIKDRVPLKMESINVSLSTLPLVLPVTIVHAVLLQLNNPAAIASISVTDASTNYILNVEDVWKYICDTEVAIANILEHLTGKSTIDDSHYAIMQNWVRSEMKALREFDFSALDKSYLAGEDISTEISEIGNLCNSVAKQLYPRTRNALDSIKESSNLFDKLADIIRTHSEDTCDCPNCTARREAEKDHPKQ